MATIRIPDDLNDRLKEIAGRRGVSATSVALDAIRQALDGTPPAPSPAPEPARAPAPPAPPAERGARVARPRSRMQLPGARTGPCPHPVTRRIGSTCSACGATVSTR